MASSTLVRAGFYRKSRDLLQEYAKARGGLTPEQLAESPGIKKVARRLADYINSGSVKGSEVQFEWGHEIATYWVKNDKYPSAKVRQKLRARAEYAHAYHEYMYKKTHPSFFSQFSPAKLISAAADVVSAVAPFVKTALSLVPGIGTGINMAISAAESLAKGRPITDAFAEAAMSAIPGGPVAQTAARTALAIAKGQRIDEAVLSAAKANLPPVAQKAFDVGLAIAHGRNLQDIAIDQVKSLAADQIHGLKLPIPAGIDVPLPEQGGFKIALGVLEKSHLPTGAALTPSAALAIRARLEPAARAGFDRAMSMRALKNLRSGSPHVPRPKLERRAAQPNLRGAWFVTSDGRVQA
jgi:hypothetical protein